MKRTREELIADIECFTEWAEYGTKSAEKHTKLAEKARKELKELDGVENEKN
jgi:hypothetical protein